MKRYRAIVDTNVVVALRSSLCASHSLLLTLGHPKWQAVVTPALMYEYEDVLWRAELELQRDKIINVLDLLYKTAHRQLVWFSWRPISPDPGDDLIVEAAIAGSCDFVVSYNQRHLRVLENFGIRVLQPADLLRIIGELE